MILRTACAIFVCLLVFQTGISAADVVDYAASLIGKPYVWGAEGPNAFDCSGLTQYVYKRFGIDLPRRAVNQADVGERIRRLQRGDLVFFSTDARRRLVTHVGIYEGRGIMIDASKRHGRVRRDNLKEEYWAERFMFAKRVSDDGRWVGDLPIPAPRDGQPEPQSRRGRDRRAETLRAIGRVAEELLRRRW